ncbi:MAG: dihydrofolate reductase [Bacteroidales bacterium]|nr:dihydrofolate reductase [Bacteroidales bacterium]
MISIIAAVSEDFGIGRNNDLLWYIPEDLERLKRLTYGKTVIMGKKTWESLPRKPLPGRKNIVISDSPGDRIENAVTAFSIEDALNKSGQAEEIFIIGGASIYRQFMPYAGRLYLTHVHMNKPADVFFPEIDTRRWKVVEREEHRNNTEGIPYSYVVYDRKDRI